MNTIVRPIIEAALNENGDDAGRLIETSTASTTELISAIRESGCLRSSRFDFRISTPARVISSLLSRGDRPSVEEVVYLESMKALFTAAKAAQTVLKGLKAAMNARSFKSYIAVADSAFRFNDSDDDSVLSLSVAMLSKEDIAASFSSYFTYFTDTRIDMERSDLSELNWKRIEGGEYMRRYKLFFVLNQLREAELSIDAYGYNARLDGNRLYVQHPDERFVQAIDLGYIRQRSQPQADEIRLGPDLATMVSLKEGAAKMIKELGDKAFDLARTPFPRLRLCLPDHDAVLNIFKSDRLFKEEYVHLTILAKELFISYRQIAEQPIFEEVTLKDLIRFQRFFFFLSAALEDYCKKRNILGTKLFLNSAILVWGVHSLPEYLVKIFGADKADAIVRLLSWQRNISPVFDVQYQPIVRWGDCYVIPSAILALSNIARNTLQHLRFRFHSDGKVDPVSDELAKALITAGFAVYRGVSFKHRAIEGEIDVIGIRDNSIFIFECKNSLLPCSGFELRTSWDYVRKAASQLNVVVQLLTDKAFVAKMEAKLNVVLPRDGRVGSCIVMGNRMFPGLKYLGQPVRPLFEVCNFITEGTWTLMATELTDALGERGSYSFDLWRSRILTAEDLHDYIGDDSAYKVMFESMNKMEGSISIGRCQMFGSRYVLDIGRMLENAKMRWRYTFTPDESRGTEVREDQGS